MLLKRALRLQPGQVVTLTGAGGKTSTLAQLVYELTPAIPVLITTTTKFGIDQLNFVPVHVIDDGRQDLNSIINRLKDQGVVLWTGPVDPEGTKWTGVDPVRIDELKPLISKLGALHLVEGDGARQRLVKAPADHEPVVPASSDLVVPLLGLGALGTPLDEQTVHRPDRLAALTSAQVGEPLTTEHLAELLTASDGGLKGVPQASEVRILLTGHTPANQAAGVEIARICLARSNRVRSVLLADLKSEDPVKRAMVRVAGVLLAAGGASRMGDLKQMREWQGKPLVSHVLDQAVQAGLDPIIVVVGEGADQVRAALTSTRAEVIDNPDWAKGQSTSMRLGLEQVQEDSEAVVFLLADMPLIRSGIIQQLKEAHSHSLAPIVAPWADDRYGNPVLFDQNAYRALREVGGDRGGKAIFDRFEVESVPADRSVLTDVDTEQDWQELTDREGDS